MLRQNRQLTRARINITVTPPRYAKPRHATPHWTERCRGGEWVETKEWNVTRLTHFRPFCCLVNLLYMFHHVAIILFCISAFRCIMYCTAQIGITIWTVSCTTLYSFCWRPSNSRLTSISVVRELDSNLLYYCCCCCYSSCNLILDSAAFIATPFISSTWERTWTWSSNRQSADKEMENERKRELNKNRHWSRPVVGRIVPYPILWWEIGCHSLLAAATIRPSWDSRAS